PQISHNSNKMSYWSRAGYLQNAKIELVISTDFDGTNVGDATWDVIPANFATAPTNGYGSEIDSGEIDISSYSGNVYIAFRYVAEAGQKADFLIDDILIYSE
ncbi:MAG: choice-of-anchor J domain-containing protein, partial [Bacteroidales bacterium]|nr:choice-of-anchor J domain-containing protein [Bacteroidales bacterium]